MYVENLANGTIQLVSRESGVAGEPAHTNCSNGVIGDNGDRVAFVCLGALDPEDKNGVSDVYVRDLVQQTTTLVSRATDGTPGNSTSGAPAIDADGTSVAFTSFATNLGVQVNGGTVVYLRDLDAETTSVVSRPTAPADAAPVQGERPSISDDGKRITFDTGQSLDRKDANDRTDVYVRILGGAAPITDLVSRRDGAGTAAGNGVSQRGVISGDGTRVLFDSTSSDLEGGDTDPQTNVYSRQLNANATALFGRKIDGAIALSIGESGQDSRVLIGRGGLIFVSGEDPTSTQLVDGLGVGRASQAAISGDGSKVAMGATGGITPDVAPDLFSVLVTDLGPQMTTRTVSRPPGNAPFLNEGGSAEFASVSADGRYAAFASTAPALGRPFGLPPGQMGVYRRDLATGELALVSRADGPAGGPLDISAFANLDIDPQISADGGHVAFAAFVSGDVRAHLYQRDLASGRTLAADVDFIPSGLSISDDGSRVAFDTFERLDPGDTDDEFDVYAFDFAANRMILVDRADGPQGAQARRAFDAAISGDGHSVAFSSDADGLVPGDVNGLFDVFVRNIDAGTTTLVSAAGDGSPGNDISGEPAISRDGNRVAFGSFAGNLGSPPGRLQVYVRDIAARTSTIASRADGADGALLTNVDQFDGVRLSADGQHVAFVAAPPVSIASGAPADGIRRVYERDLSDGVTRLISRRTGVDGAPSDAFALDEVLSITAGGECVVFSGLGSLLTPPGNADFTNVYLRAVKTDCGRVVQPTAEPAATLSRLSVKPRRFHVGGRKGGTKISFRLSRASAVTLVFDRLLPGHRAKAKKPVKGKKGKAGRCTTRVHRGKRCTVAKRVGRSQLKQGRLHQGVNRVKFAGKLGRKALKPGRYRLTATPLHGRGRTVGFVVVKAPKLTSTKHPKG